MAGQIQRKKKADTSRIDLRLITIEDAVEFVNPDKWMLCPICKSDCIIMDRDGIIGLSNGMFFLWLAGQCRHCRSGAFLCQDCGDRYIIPVNTSKFCYCGHEWKVSKRSIEIRLKGNSDFFDCRDWMHYF